MFERWAAILEDQMQIDIFGAGKRGAIGHGGDATDEVRGNYRIGHSVMKDALDAEDEGEATVVQLSDQFLFDFGSAELRPTATRSLDTVVAVLEEGEAPVEVTGHTDSLGGDAVNQPLSQERARAVADYLVEQGIEESRITAQGRGSSEPVAPNTHEDGRDDPEGRQENRRVEIRYAEES